MKAFNCLKPAKVFLLVMSTLLLSVTLATAKPITIKLGHCNAPSKTDPYHLTSLYFAEALEEFAPGQFDVQIFPNRQLGDEKEMIEGVGFGTLDMAVITNSPISRISAPFQINDMPFIYPSAEHAHEILDGPVGQKLLSTLEPKGIVGLGFAEGGFRHMINNVRPIKTASDVSGIKWRVMPNPVYIEMFRALGGNAVPMPWGEVFTAIQQGTVDGLEIPLPVIYSTGYYETVEYCSLTNHTYSALGVLFSKQKFDDLSSEQQDAVRKAAKKAIQQERKQNRKNARKTIEMLKEKGMKVNRVSDFKPFQEKVTKVYDKFRESIGDEIFDKVLAK